jgi:O-antigen/teichoic acid export membrane protein
MSLLNAAFLTVYCKKKYPGIKYNYKPQKQLINKRHAAFGGQIAGLIHNSATIAIATFFVSLQEISVYSVYALITVNVSGMIFLFSNSIAPSFGDIVSRNEHESLDRNFKLFDHAFTMLSAVVFICIAILVVPFISVYTKNISDIDYFRPVLALLMTVSALTTAMGTPLDIIGNSSGVYKEMFIITAIQAGIMLAFGFALVFVWQLVGLIVALILSNVFRIIAMMILIKKTFAFLQLKKILLNRLHQIVLFSVCVVPFYFIKLQPSGYLYWFLEAAAIFIIITAVVIVYNIVFCRKSMAELKDKFMQILSARRKKALPVAATAAPGSVDKEQAGSENNDGHSEGEN